MVARMEIQGWRQLEEAASIANERTINILLNSTRAHNFNNIINNTTFLLLDTVCLLRTLQLAVATSLPSTGWITVGVGACLFFCDFGGAAK